MMKDYRQLLQLYQKGLPVNRIANILGCKWETVRDAMERMKVAYGALESIPDGDGDREIADRIRQSQSTKGNTCMPIDCEDVLKRKRKGESIESQWAEYVKIAKECNRPSYGRSRYCEIVAEFAREHDIAIAIEKQPGIKCEVDWVGDKAHIIDVDTGDPVSVHIFVMVLPYSGYFYCEGFLDEKMSSWLAGHMHAFSFFGGVPVVLVPDNCRAAVTEGRHDSYDDVVLNPRYRDFAEHYGIVVRPARIRHPKDKSVVERSVQIIEKDILPEMARLDIFTLHEFNSILHRKLARRLAKPYTKRYGSRASVFDEEEKTTLLPLPVAGYHSYTEKEAAVGRDGYIQYSSAFYSVPPSFIKKKVIVRESEGRLYIYDDRRQLIAEHDKAVRKWQRVTSEEHRKADLALYGGYSREEFDDRARSIGPAMFTWVQAVKDRCDCFADSYRTLLGVFSGIGKYPAHAVEEAARQANNTGIYSARGFKALVAYNASSMQAEKARKQDINDIYISHED